MHPSPPSLPGSARYSHLVCVCVRRSGEKGGGDGRKTLTTRAFYRYTEKDYDIEMGGIDQYM